MRTLIIESLFNFIFTFGESPIPDFNFFATHSLCKLTCFYKFIHHSNKKLLTVFFHQIKLFIRIFYRVDKTGYSKRSIGEDANHIVNYFFTLCQFLFPDNNAVTLRTKAD